MLASAALDENTGGELPDFKAEICYSLGGIVGLYPMFAERYEWLCSRYKNEPYYTIPVLSSSRGGFVYEKSWFKTGNFMDFEGERVPVPSSWREVLVASYPDGLLEPEKEYELSSKPKEKIIIDTKRSYKEYVTCYTDMLKGIEGKKVYIFGAADSLRIWLERYSEGLDVICAFDNSESKWGKTAYDVPVCSPEDLPGMLGKDSRLIVASMYHKEICEQLDNMDVGDYYVFIDGWNYLKG